MTTISNKHEAVSLIERNRSYARLFKAVILRAVQDLARAEHKDEAREWLLSFESDYAFATAGIRPDSLRQQVI